MCCIIERSQIECANGDNDGFGVCWKQNMPKNNDDLGRWTSLLLTYTRRPAMISNDSWTSHECMCFATHELGKHSHWCGHTRATWPHTCMIRMPYTILSPVLKRHFRLRIERMGLKRTIVTYHRDVPLWSAIGRCASSRTYGHKLELVPLVQLRAQQALALSPHIRFPFDRTCERAYMRWLARVWVRCVLLVTLCSNPG